MTAHRSVRLVTTIGVVCVALGLVAVIVSSQSHDQAALAQTPADSSTSAASLAPAPPESASPVIAASAADTVSAPLTTPSTDAPVVVAIGDSIMDGHGTMSADDAWPVLLAEQNNWQLTNLATDGAGFVQQGDNGETFLDEADQAIALNPSIVIISASSNDLGEDPAAVADATSTTLAALRDALPHAQIIALSAFWGDTTPPDELTGLSADLQSAAQADGAAYVDIGQPLTDRGDLMQDDDVHPTAEGLAVLASTIGPLLPPA